MEVLHHPGSCPPASADCVLTIGAYDGVHLGHRHLIGQVRTMADELGCASAVVTFDRHPAMVVRPDSAPRLLTDLDQKLELLASTGVDYTLVVHFDRERSEESAEGFVTEVLVGCLRAQAVVVGHDFHFGHRRQGDVPLLQRMGAVYGFDVHGLRLMAQGPDGEAVSSTRIRELLGAGDVEQAARLLGRPHEVRGLAVAAGAAGPAAGTGDAGDPAPIAVRVAVPVEIQVPAAGEYAGWYLGPDRSPRPSLLEVGGRPGPVPVDGDAVMMEARLLDGGGAPEAGPAAVRFVARLRAGAAAADQGADQVDALRLLLDR
jgi:riboflavin kinase/FMN adenylyltransferase